MDNDDILVIYVILFAFCLLTLLFTSYNFTHNIPALLIIYPMMIITALCMLYSIGLAAR